MTLPKTFLRAALKTLRGWWLLLMLLTWELLKARFATWVNSAIDEKTPTILKEAGLLIEKLSESRLACTIAIAVLVFVLLFAHAYWHEARKIKTLGTETFNNLPHLHSPKKISLPEAARIAYEEVRGSAVMDVMEETIGDQNKILGYMAGKLLDSGDLPVTGALYPAEKIANIPTEHATTYGVSGDATELFDRHNETRKYRFLEVDTGQLRNRLDALKNEWGIGDDSKSEQSQIGDDRVAIIQLRDRAAENGWDFASQTSNHILDFARALQQAGLDEAVLFWGRADRNTYLGLTKDEPLDAIPNNHWRDFKIEPLSLRAAHTNCETFTYAMRRDQEKGYRDIHVQFDTAWKWIQRHESEFKGKR